MQTINYSFKLSYDSYENQRYVVAQRWMKFQDFNRAVFALRKQACYQHRRTVIDHVMPAMERIRRASSSTSLFERCRTGWLPRKARYFLYYANSLKAIGRKVYTEKTSLNTDAYPVHKIKASGCLSVFLYVFTHAVQKTYGKNCLAHHLVSIGFGFVRVYRHMLFQRSKLLPACNSVVTILLLNTRHMFPRYCIQMSRSGVLKQGTSTLHGGHEQRPSLGR